ncbi:c-type cytochrome [Pontibacter virosus]|uniref:Cytochrome c n=1 Tax=Pontibacter virosus TaxID=1765052 RepID=A0A2U1AXP1_9BACT|nr:c-type cytochrome [Pontibacter virosus]PVY41196.1 cytochrome c [Pontibacter virosus]
MKNMIMLLGCCALLAACNSGDESTTTEDRQIGNSEVDSTAAAAVNAAIRQPEVDTSIMNIGTDRTAGATSTQSTVKGEKLIAQSDCMACHRVDEKLVGPSYTEVARKYEATDKNIDYLASKIIEGGAGVWGEIPMAAHPNISREDAREMARYIVSLR